MRLNKFIAAHSSLSRRSADAAIAAGRVQINGTVPAAGDNVAPGDVVTLDGKTLAHNTDITTLILHKPAGYVCSRQGQGSKTVYDLLPSHLQHLQSVGRLDKDSSGLLLMTNDGDLAHQLTHPSYQKIKHYEITLDKALEPLHQQMIADIGIQLEDGFSRLQLDRRDDTRRSWGVTMHEGRNRQIRRTFSALGYQVTTLHRTLFGPYLLHDLPSGQVRVV